MEQSAVTVIILAGMPFALIGATMMVALIIYQEYRHHFKSNREPRQAAFRAWVLTFLFFMGLILLLAWVLPGIIASHGN